jgi:hypothetical protein
MDSEGYVLISLLAGFNRVKALTMDEKLVREVHVHFFLPLCCMYY